MTTDQTQPDLRMLAVSGAVYMTATGCTMDEAKSVARQWLMSPHPISAALQDIARVIGPRDPFRVSPVRELG